MDKVFHSEKIEVENINENISNNPGQEDFNQEEEIEQSEINENNKVNNDINKPNSDNNAFQKNNIAQIKEYPANSENSLFKKWTKCGKFCK